MKNTAMENFQKILNEKNIQFEKIKNGLKIIGGSVDLSSDKEKISTPYLERFNIENNDGLIVLYKKVSSDFKTQENTDNETLWLSGTSVEHSAY